MDARERKEGLLCVRVADVPHVRSAESLLKKATAADAERKLQSVRVRNKSIWF
jgi:hypothetical protein